MPQYRLQSRIDVRPAHWRGPLARAVCRIALAAGIICAATAVACAGDDDTQASGGSLYDQVLASDRRFGGGANINYSERSPLVVPPTNDLPPPSADAPPAVPDWPKDPDVARRAKAKVKERPHPHPDYVVEFVASAAAR